MMKALFRCGLFMMIPWLANCAATDSSSLEKEAEALGDSRSRKELYSAFPPLEKPQPHPVLATSNGVSGYESYPVSAKHEISYTVRYAASLGGQELIFTDEKAPNIPISPRDQTSKFEIRERN